jgi:hypothetical protein
VDITTIADGYLGGQMSEVLAGENAPTAEVATGIAIAESAEARQESAEAAQAAENAQAIAVDASAEASSATGIAMEASEQASTATSATMSLQEQVEELRDGQRAILEALQPPAERESAPKPPESKARTKAEGIATAEEGKPKMTRQERHQSTFWKGM